MYGGPIATHETNKKNLKSSRERSQEVPSVFRTPVYRAAAHCAVIFAIAQLSCYSMVIVYRLQMEITGMVSFMIKFKIHVPQCTRTHHFYRATLCVARS